MPSKMTYVACWLILLAGPPAQAQEDSSSPVAVLELAAAGLTLNLPGREPVRFASIEELLGAHPGLAGRFHVEKAAPAVAGRIEPDLRKKKSQPVDILAGSVSALELLQFLADYTGLPIVHDSSDKTLASVRVPFTADVKGADYEVVKAHLEAAGLRISERKLPGGRRLIEVSGGSGSTRPRPLKPRPIIVVGREKGSGAKIQRRRQAAEPGRPVLEDYMGVVLTRVPGILRAQLPITSREGVLALDVDRNLAQLRNDLRILERYDVITTIDRRPVSTPAAMVEELNRFSKGDEFTLRLYRKGSLKIYRVRR